MKKAFFPYFIVILLTTLFLTIASLSPYYIDNDVGLQFKSIKQFIAQETPFLNFVTFPNIADLSQDNNFWIVWYPPGISLAFYPLLALGLPLGIAARLTSYVLFLSGSFGWLKLAKKIKVSYFTLVIYAIILPIYALSIDSITKLENGDIISFAVMPWLFVYVVYIVNLKSLFTRKFLLNFITVCGLLGLVYWVKYSAFLVALTLLCYLLIDLVFFRKNYSNEPEILPKKLLRKKIIVALLGIFCFTIAPVTLSLINNYFTGSFNYATQAEQTNFRITVINDPTVKGFPLFISLLGTPGLYLFQSAKILMHFIYFSDQYFNIFANLTFNQRGIFLGIFGIPGTTLLVFVLAKNFQKTDWKTLILACCSGFIPLFFLAYLTQKIGYNFLIYNTRHAMAHFMIIEILLIESTIYYLKQSLTNQKWKVIQKAFLILLILIFGLLPNFFNLSLFFKDYVLDQIKTKPYISDVEKIYVPSLSKVNVRAVLAQIEAIQSASNTSNVVVLALENFSSSSMDAWLSIKFRTIFLGTNLFLGKEYLEALSLYGNQPMLTSQNLRLTLVVSKILARDSHYMNKLKKRFPQATNWMQVVPSQLANSEVSIYYTDLKAGPILPQKL